MSRKRKMILLTLILIIASGAVISGIIVNNIKGEKTESTEVPHKILYVYMPDLVGHMEDSAFSKLNDIGFYNIKIEYEKTGSSEAGRVNRQSIPPNATVGTDFEIILYIEEP